MKRTTSIHSSDLISHDGGKHSRRAFLQSLLGVGALAVGPLAAADASSATGATDLPNSAIEQAARRNSLCSAGNAVGVGLRGEYFAEEECRGAPMLVRTDSTIDFDASMEWPERLARTPPRSARWSGWIKPPLSGSYRFHLPVPNGSVTVARQLLSGTGAAPDATIKLEAGRFYPVALRMARLDTRPDQRIRFEWTAPYGARYVVPRALLHLPTETVGPTT